MTRNKILAAGCAVFLAGIICGAFLFQALLHKHAYQFQERRDNRGNYLTNPLLECEQFQGSDSQLVLVKTDLVKFINSKKAQYKDLLVAVYVRDLNNGPWIGINEKELFAPASLLKVPLMMAYFKLAETNPNALRAMIKYEQEIVDPYQIKRDDMLQVGQSYSASQLIRHMIVDSDNVAKELLQLNISAEDLLRVHIDLNMAIPDVRKAEDFISVQEYTSFFRILYNASYLNRDSSNQALKLLTETGFNQGIVAGVPAQVTVAHKYGIFRKEPNIVQLHDCGIVYFPKSPYLLCIMTRGMDESVLTSIIAEISRVVYEHKQKYAS